ncbi:MAG TPA: hypothetical protein ENG07_00985 [Candidatus Bathyarchaeota archaeon]|nr:hypothetical protein [Candidatus Bathyarchaeota archaeon]
MSGRSEKIVYFTEAGPQNTDEVLSLALERAKERGIKSIVVASTYGDTGVKATEVFKGYNVVVVTHYTGFKAPNVQQLTEENRKKILENGGKILTATHAFGGIGRAVRNKFGTYEVDELVANVLRIFGQGMKVACEIVTMAADAGYVRTDEDVIAIAGSSRGADTAIVVRPVNVCNFFDMKVKEIICMPR